MNVRRNCRMRGLRCMTCRTDKMRQHRIRQKCRMRLMICRPKQKCITYSNPPDKSQTRYHRSRLYSSDLALSLSQIQGTAGSCDPLSQIPTHFHYLCLGIIELSRWENWKPPAVSLVGPSGDHSQSLCSLSLQKPYGNRFVWNCLDRPITIGILNGKICYKKITIVTKKT